MVNVTIRFTAIFNPEDRSTVSEIFEKFNVITTSTDSVGVVKCAGRNFYKASRKCTCDLNRLENLVQYLDSNDTPHVNISIG